MKKKIEKKRPLFLWPIPPCTAQTLLRRSSYLELAQYCNIEDETLCLLLALSTWHCAYAFMSVPRPPSISYLNALPTVDDVRVIIDCPIVTFLISSYIIRILCVLTVLLLPLIIYLQFYYARSQLMIS